MAQVVNDRIARRAAELHEKRTAPQREAGLAAAQAWLANGPVKIGARFRPTSADRRALERAA